MKKLINAPDAVVADSLRGMEAAHPDLIKVQYGPNIVVRKDAPISGKVGIISGGGSGHDEVEIGIGIHGEPGRFREKIGPASQIAERLMTPILEDLPFNSGDKVLAFVNGMGGTPLIELYVMYDEVAKIAQEHGLTIER